MTTKKHKLKQNISGKRLIYCFWSFPFLWPRFCDGLNLHSSQPMMEMMEKGRGMPGQASQVPKPRERGGEGKRKGEGKGDRQGRREGKGKE